MREIQGDGGREGLHGDVPGEFHGEIHGDVRGDVRGEIHSDVHGAAGGTDAAALVPAEVPALDVDRSDVVLPAFEMDCRDWLVATPDEAGLPDDVDGAPLLAVLSSAVVDSDDLHSVSAVITVGLLDEDTPLAVAPEGCVAAEVVDSFGEDDDVAVRYIVPAPGGNLALLAEFSVRSGAGVVAAGRAVRGTDPELTRRIEALMTSFRWAA